MSRLLLFNLATDADDPVLGFTSGWVRALAARYTQVDVITMRAGRIDLPANVRVFSVGKERGWSEPRRALEFYRVLGRLVREGSVDACFSHMIPIFSVLAAPLLRLRHIPLVTWYAHPQVSNTLRLAHHLSNRMVASVASAYPYRRHKLSVIGQGIDTDLYTPGDPPPAGPPLILCAGRLSPVKDHPTLLRAIALLRRRGTPPFRVAIVGPPLGPEAEQYRAELRNLARDLALNDIVTFEPPVPPASMPDWYRRCTIHVNLTPTGFGDKVAWEAMSCGRLCLAANEGFRETFGAHADALLFPHGDAGTLAERLAWAITLTEETRAAIGADLRRQVVALHSLAGLPERLAHVFTELLP